ncbi:hypothetical protein IWX64_003301 [Arthrobacter sp. CAN_A212]|uniref:hypothetical protein n=1 Tax=Arthrobacter sp. CAN_A212 TaxID=2787719 RepID=UPI0018CAF1E1
MIAALILGATVGAAIGVIAVVAGIGAPRTSALEGRSIGLASVYAIFGAGIGVVLGAAVGGAVWKLDHLLASNWTYFKRSAAECLLITIVTATTSSIAFIGLPAALVVAMFLVGGLLAAVASGLYFFVRFR